MATAKKAAPKAAAAKASATGSGRVTQVIGAVVDVQFDGEVSSSSAVLQLCRIFLLRAKRGKVAML